MDLRYDLLPDGVKETLVLANAQAPLSYRFRLTPPAGARVHAEAAEDGSWSFFHAPQRRPVFVLEAPWAAEQGTPLPRVRHAALDVTRARNDFLLDLSVDGAWLRDASRRFPIIVNPTITIQPDFQDASFDFACLTCKGVSSERLSIGTTDFPVVRTWRSAVQFSLADIPVGATVNSASLKLYFNDTCVVRIWPGEDEGELVDSEMASDFASFLRRFAEER